MDADQRTLLEKLAVAKSVINSEPCLSIEPAPMWCDISTVHRVWLAEVVHQARAEAATTIAALSARVAELELAGAKV